MIQSLEVQIVQENNNKSSSSMKMVHCLTIEIWDHLT